MPALRSFLKTLLARLGPAYSDNCGQLNREFAVIDGGMLCEGCANKFSGASTMVDLSLFVTRKLTFG